MANLQGIETLHWCPEGTVADMLGEWLDILPLCLGDTDPGVRGGTWKASSKTVQCQQGFWTRTASGAASHSVQRIL